MVPSGWQVHCGYEIADKITKGASPKWQGYEYQNGGMLFVTSENVRDGRLDISEPKFLPLEFHDKLKNSQLALDDVLINIVGASIGRACLYDAPSKHANINQAVCLFRVGQKATSRYILYYLQLPRTVRRLLSSQSETARPNLSLTDIKQFRFEILPLVEQKKIVHILSTWDKAIETVEKLIENSKAQKKALMQQLLTGRRQFPQFRERRWRSLKANEVFLTASIRKNVEEELLAVTQDRGVVPRSSLDRKVVMPEGSTESYKLVEPGDFVISLRSFQGGIEYSPYRGLVSPAYHVLKLKLPIVDSFYKHYFKSYDFIGHLAVAVIGIRDGKQISYSDFSFLQIPYPELDEQRYIAITLDAIDKELTNHRKQLDAIMN